MRRVLLTGSSGFVGGYLAAAIRERWPETVLQGLNASGRVRSEIDLRDQVSIFAAVREARPDVIVHLAGQSSVAGAGGDGAATTWSVNLTGTLNLALAMAAHAPEALLLFASSAEVYGASFLGGPVDEASATLPMNAYARSKAAAERMLADVLPASARLIVARPFNHTGPGQREDFVLPSFAGQVARIEAGRQAPRMAVGNLDVHRDFLDVRDVAAAYLALIDAAPDLPTRFTCNIASGTARRLRDLLDMLQGLSRRPFEIAVDPARLRPVDLPVAVADPALLRAVTGWSPRFSIEDTLASLLETARGRVEADSESACRVS